MATASNTRTYHTVQYDEPAVRIGHGLRLTQQQSADRPVIISSFQALGRSDLY